MRCKFLHIIFCDIILSGCCTTKGGFHRSVYLNGVHSRLNKTRVARVFYPTSTEQILKIIQKAKKDNKAVSISGGRHAMGGQQFGDDTYHISMTKMNEVLSFDRPKGI